MPNWHAGLVAPPKDFPKECSLSLTRGEAEYLAERIRLSPGCSGSLLAELVTQRQRYDDVPFAWHHPHRAKLAPRLREMLVHAQNFSEVMHGAPLLYNLMLTEQALRKEGVAKYRRSFGEWAKSISARARVLAQWDRKRFWEIVRSVNPIRIQLPASLDNEKRYDFSLVLPEPESQGQMTDRIRTGIEDYFHANVSREDRVVDAYVLSLEPNGKRPPAKPPANDGMGGNRSSGVTFEAPSSLDEAIAGSKPQPISSIRGISADGTADEFCHTLEFTLDRPVVNETDLKGEFVFRIEDSRGAENDFLDHLRNQLGLVVAPSQRSVEMLVLEPR